MKKTIRSLITYIIVACVIVYLIVSFLPGKSLTEKSFKERIDKLELKFDSMSVKIDTIYEITKTNRTDFKRIDKNVDTLKKGQYVIFKQVSKKDDFLSKLKDLF